MSAVIKSGMLGGGLAVRPLGVTGRTANEPRPWIDPEIVALRAEVEHLTAILRDHEARIAGHPDALDKARAEGEMAGRQAGLKEAGDGQAALLKVITSAVETALGELSTGIAALERLAPALALTGLEKILGPNEDRAGLMPQLIGKQLAELKAQAVVAVEVSRADFSDEDLEALRRPGVTARALDSLKSGDCRLVLQLGAMEVGLDQQWGRLREVLADLAEPETGA